MIHSSILQIRPKRIRVFSFIITFFLFLLLTVSQVFAGSFHITFFDVNQGDSALVECDNHYMLIDGGKPEASQKLYTYFKNNHISTLDYIVATHPDADHIGGLSGALNYATANVALSPVRTDSTKTFTSFVKYLKNTGITIPAAGETYTLGSASFQIVGPINTNASDNNLSIVLRLVYGNTSYLFTGDAEADEELSILKSGYTVKSNLLKIGHHGSSSSSTKAFLDAVNPDYAVISVGKNNSYGHPTAETLSKLKGRSLNLYRTDLHGDILVTSDGTNISITPAKNAGADPYVSMSEGGEGRVSSMNAANGGSTGASGTQESTYILNTNSKKFHYPDCASVRKMSKANKKEFNGTRELAIANGYSPCKNCKP